VPAGEVAGWRARLAAAAFVAGWELARRLPEAVVFAGANLGGWLAWYSSPGLRAGITRNLARVVPAGDLERCARDAFGSYARYWVESFRSTDLSREDLDRRTTTAGFEHLDRALTEGKGVIVLLAHHGSWDVAARWAEDHGYHMAAVAEVLEPRRLFERFVRLRESIGLEIVPLAGRHRGMRLARVLAANHLVGLLSDRDLGGSGMVVPLFGDAAALPRGPVVLSQRTGAPIVPITMLQRPGRRWHLQVLPPVDVRGEAIESGVQRVAKALEELIRLAPEQWHAFSPVFLSDESDRPERS